MNELTKQSEQETELNEIELVDCGEASKVTKGSPFHWIPEVGVPPWDKVLP